MNNIIISGDAHLSNNLPWSEEDSRHKYITNRFVEQINILKKIANKVNELLAPSIFTGDLTDGRTYDSIVLKWLIRTLNRFEDTNQECFFMAGNHDYESKDREQSTFQFLREIYKNTNLHFIDKPCIRSLDKQKLLIAFVPYIYDKEQIIIDIERVIHNLHTVYKHSSYKKMLVFHGDVYKAKWEHRTIKSGLKLFDIQGINEFDYIIGGHVHVAQKLQPRGQLDRLKHAFYTGSLIQKNLNEVGSNKFYYILNIKTDKLTRIKLNKDFTNFYIVNDEGDLKRALKLENHSIIEVRMNIEDHEEEINELKKKHKVITRTTKNVSKIVEQFSKAKQIISWESIMLNEIKKFEGNSKSLEAKHFEVLKEVRK